MHLRANSVTLFTRSIQIPEGPIRMWLSGTITLVVIAVWAIAVAINRACVTRYHGRGDGTTGIVVFVEPVRWLFVVWGFGGACRGLRRAGIPHAIHLFQWSNRAGSLFVLPDLMRQCRLNRKAKRLAKFIEQLVKDHPGVPIHLIGYSTGVYVACEAIKVLPPDVRVGRMIALHGTVSSDYELTEVLARTDSVINVYSRGDWIINGLGPLLFGTNDRVHAVACGMVGFRRPREGLVDRPWSWNDIRKGYFGDHFTVMSSVWIRDQIAPLLR